MPKVTFHATPNFQTWKHQNGGVTVGQYGDKETLKIRGPVILRDGDSVEMDDFEAQWAVTNHPSEFSVEGIEDAPAVPHRKKRVA